MAQTPGSTGRIAFRPVSVIFIGVCLLGFFLRIYFFVVDRSLWLDEAMLAVNLVDRSFLDLLKPLDYDQGAPVGFLILQKAVISALGSQDYILRIIPLLAGLAAIPLMYFTSKRYSKGLAPFLSLGLFAFSARLIYYSSELKQYSSDVFITLLLLFIIPKCLTDKTRVFDLVALGIAGVLAMWLSHPAFFILLAILLTLGLNILITRDRQRLGWVMGLAGIWGINFLFVYLISLRYLAANSALLDYWSGNFAPLPPWSNLAWYYDAFVNMLRDIAGQPVKIALVPLILGIASYIFRRSLLTVMLVAPFLFALIASAFGKYPFSGRLLLFALPLLLLLIAEGVERLRVVLLRVNGSVSLLASIFLCAILFYTPIVDAFENLKSPPMAENIKPLMSRLSTNRLGSDFIYVYYGAKPAFEFYAPQYGLGQNNLVLGVSARNAPEKYLQDVDALKGNQRVWFLFLHDCNWCAVDEESFFLDHLNAIGSKEDERVVDGASLYLYDLAPIK